VETFSFAGLRLDTALRNFLEKFRLPGEALMIDRIIEAFSKHYFAQNADSVLGHEDTVFVLSFSLIMLQTDLHSRQIAEEKKMTLAQFVRNNRGINQGADVPREMLEELYAAIKAEEIRVQADVADVASAAGGSGGGGTAGGGGGGGDADAAADATWDGILRRRADVADASFTPALAVRRGARGRSVAGAAAGALFRAGAAERDMFLILADASLPALRAALEGTRDGALLAKVAQALASLAQIAAYFRLRPQLFQVLHTLCRCAAPPSRPAADPPASPTDRRTERASGRASGRSTDGRSTDRPH
jgi:brefeldin A-resistance guanine nucleotide exchange factor 1